MRIQRHVNRDPWPFRGLWNWKLDAAFCITLGKSPAFLTLQIYLRYNSWTRIKTFSSCSTLSPRSFSSKAYLMLSMWLYLVTTGYVLLRLAIFSQWWMLLRPRPSWLGMGLKFSHSIALSFLSAGGISGSVLLSSRRKKKKKLVWLFFSGCSRSPLSLQVGNLGLLFMLLFFIFAALGVELFGDLSKHNAH